MNARKRILVVDRDPLVRHCVTRALRADCVVSAADDPESAWTKLEAGEAFDLVLCEARGDGRLGWSWLVARRPDIATRLVLMTPRDAPASPRDDTSTRLPRLTKPLADAAVREMVRGWPAETRHEEDS
jgi:DNA-binding NarL/FixJ family response regulator